MSSFTSSRMTSKQADARDRRSRMTQQRRNLSNKIRKQKKSEFLAKKRNLSTSRDSYNSSESLVHELMHAYTQTPTLGNLTAMEKTLPVEARNASEEKPLLYLSQEEESVAITLLECLRRHAIAERKLLTLCLQILVKLTAISHIKNLSSETSYYGRVPSSWCVLMIQNPALINLIVKQCRNYDSSIIILGNLVGDPSSAQVCPTLRQSDMVPALVSCIQDQQPAAVWALTNAIRNDTTTWASAYCSDSLLSVSMLETLLRSTSPKVATQAAWMAASLLSREQAVVQYLVSHSTFCSTLLTCVQQPADSQNDRLVPLLQSLGYIASYEEYVVHLIQTLPSLIPTLMKLLQTTNTSKEVLINSVWLAGCLLVDARIEDHPSTVLAAPHLIPILFRLLQNQQVSLEERRDIAHALWNALSLPPACVSHGNLSILQSFLPEKQMIRSSLANLVGLLGSPDPDAVMASLNVLYLLLRQDESLQVYMEEQNMKSVLEDLCDSIMHEAAEVAADMLDDYFYKDDDGEEDMMAPHASANGTFSFGGFPNPVYPQQQEVGEQGLGRGRGVPMVPSWMTKK